MPLICWCYASFQYWLRLPFSCKDIKPQCIFFSSFQALCDHLTALHKSLARQRSFPLFLFLQCYYCLTLFKLSKLCTFYLVFMIDSNAYAIRSSFIHFSCAYAHAMQPELFTQCHCMKAQIFICNADYIYFFFQVEGIFHCPSGIGSATKGLLNWIASAPCPISAFPFLNYLFDFIMRKCHSWLCVVSNLSHDFQDMLCTVVGALWCVPVIATLLKLTPAQWINHCGRYPWISRICYAGKKVTSDWWLYSQSKTTSFEAWRILKFRVMLTVASLEVLELA